MYQRRYVLHDQSGGDVDTMTVEPFSCDCQCFPKAAHSVEHQATYHASSRNRADPTELDRTSLGHY
jgi:hypothetical protein